MAVNKFNYSVSWSDFKELSSRPQGVKEDAQIHPEMAFRNFQVGKDGNAVIIKDVEIDIELVASDCWVVRTAKSNDLLKHEQGHFDILAICARELYAALLAIRATSTRDLQKQLDKEKNRLGKQVKIDDARYDTKTNHGLNQAVQQAWDQKIDSIKKNKHGSLNDLPG
jgi:Bacterial protein of unknown function (DUF922)